MTSRGNREFPSHQTEPTPFAARAKDLGALRDAVVDAASVGAGLWLSYLFVLFYFAIAAGAVTHRDLLLENPVKLPFLNVELPLKVFFVLGPLVFLIVHAYVLLHFALLAGKVGAFHAELQVEIDDDEVRARLRRQLPSNIFVQSLAGPREVRRGIIGFLLRLIVQISLVAGPIALLVLFQLQFLPYHNEWITSWQRIAVVIDLSLLWILWPPIARGETARLGWNDFERVNIQVWALVSLLSILLVFTIATFPGEWLEKNLLSMPLVPTTWTAVLSSDQRALLGWATPHQLLVAGAVDYVAQRPKSLWSNVLVLPNFEIGDRVKFDREGKIAISSDTLSLRGRSLEGAVLVNAHLSKADFTGAQLTGVKLGSADLREAKFDCDAVGDGSKCAQLRGADLSGAYLQNADLSEADLQAADLSEAHLQGADLSGAHLQGADLSDARLQGADLTGAHLQGADLSEAHLQGVDLSVAQLQGALLIASGLQGADLSEAHLQGAFLLGAGLEGADLSDTHLQGADLSEAHLQGADLSNAQLQAAVVDRSSVWRANPPTKQEAKDIWAEPNTGSDWTPASFAALKELINNQVPPGKRRDEAVKRIAVLEKPPNAADQTTAKAWAALFDPKLTHAQYLTALAGTLQQAFCTTESSPEAIAGLIQQFEFRFGDDERQEAELAEVFFLNGTRCPGARGLSEETKATLRQIRGRIKPPPPAVGPGSR